MNCPKCQGEMEEGVSVDKTNFDPGIQSWGSKINSGLLKSHTIENEKKIKSFRCVGCGFLESYAK